jgi:hypothetical protein
VLTSSQTGKGSCTSVGDDEIGLLFLGIINAGTRPSRFGNIETETGKYVVNPTGLEAENDCVGEGQEQV